MRIKLIIQNLTTTLGSAQPFSSKWWWNGAIKNTLFFLYLKDITWIITDNASSTNIPQIDNNGNVRTKEEINMDGLGILSFVSNKVPKQISTLINRNNLNIDDIDLFVFHQASKMALDSLKRILKISDEKIFINLENIGNTVSASIPIALYDALKENNINKGSKIIISGFGVGLSWGTALLQY